MRALERDPDPGTNHPEGESEVTEEVYLYQIMGDKSSNPAVTLQVNKVLVTLHLHMQADVTVITEKHFESLKGTSCLQPTKDLIRSYLRDGPGPALPLLGCFTASLSRNKKSIVEVVYVVKGCNVCVSIPAFDNYAGLGFVVDTQTAEQKIKSDKLRQYPTWCQKRDLPSSMDLVGVQSP